MDKTDCIYELISRESNCFLSRPRRFGKSLLISTFKELFSGNKELFKNCWIYDKIEWLEYPIIHLDFLDVDYKTLGLEQALDDTLNTLANKFDIQLKKKSIKGKFSELIDLLSRDKQVVILVDEYDKPIIDYMDNIPKAVKNRDLLKNFYSTLKAKNANIRFLFITGVSKFSQISIFSDLNHLNDITIHPFYSKMLGYTQEEIEHYFTNYIVDWESKTGENRAVLFEKLKDHYNGYSWDGINFVYNPFSILSFFGSYQFKNYWFATGSPTFLVNILKKTGVSIDQYERLRVNESFFEKFDIETMGIDNISSLLFQTGYLTIKEIKDQKYILSYPNREVKTAFLQYLLEGFSNKPGYETNEITLKIKQSLAENKIDDFIREIKVLLSSIPYNIQIETREAYYHSLIYVALKISMMDVQAEIQTALGRSDIVVCIDRYVYIIEFKMGNAQTALDQIEDKQYYASYLRKNKKIILLGIGLAETQRNIMEWKSREISETGEQIKPGTSKELKEEKRQMIKQMLADKLPMELIVKYSGLSEAEIKGL
ncbi:MAG: ATP-binding protein [Acidobacteria bacterium]|nr:ATP-binding protein [Acidobacteriota bacterium]